MQLIGERLICAPIATTWQALNDPEVLRSCIAGCESLERTGADLLSAVMAVKVGPVSARFKGTLKMSDVKPPHSYSIAFDGRGGVAGFGSGVAEVMLSQEEKGTRLRYKAQAQVGGKLAQVGSRLVDAVAAKITEDFFTAFEARLQPPADAPQPETEAPRGVPAWAWLVGAVLVCAGAWILTHW
ncbi:carbon monoxide dehydrogenase subunit G [Piscinibacter sp. XHJ-5]|uniref:CoxG family protein n=1 Tax=Piscinibacter sp. XHJ-5 TaxID=3037797 RepID=UPI002452BBA8|nr:carbon monoxide dehydrogenase subunit G [Piscinibacter sp. XHJ-5]